MVTSGHILIVTMLDSAAGGSIAALQSDTSSARASAVANRYAVRYSSGTRRRTPVERGDGKEIYDLYACY